MDSQRRKLSDELKLMHDVHVPEFWDIKESFDLIISNDSLDLIKIFQMTPTVYRNTLKKVFPNKPENQTYAQYVKMLPTGNTIKKDKTVSRVVSEEDEAFAAYKGNKELVTEEMIAEDQRYIDTLYK